MGSKFCKQVNPIQFFFNSVGPIHMVLIYARTGSLLHVNTFVHKHKQHVVCYKKKITIVPIDPCIVFFNISNFTNLISASHYQIFCRYPCILALFLASHCNSLRTTTTTYPFHKDRKRKALTLPIIYIFKVVPLLILRTITTCLVDDYLVALDSVYL